MRLIDLKLTAEFLERMLQFPHGVKIASIQKREAGGFCITCAVSHSAVDKEGNTPLIFAVENSNLELVSLLVENNAITSIENATGTTALMLAAAFRGKETKRASGVCCRGASSIPLRAIHSGAQQ